MLPNLSAKKVDFSVQVALDDVLEGNHNSVVHHNQNWVIPRSEYPVELTPCSGFHSHAKQCLDVLRLVATCHENVDEFLDPLLET